jgi:ABC-type antimicrobial peptide transport system permease subunit
MPYFFIFPVYVGLVSLGILAGLVLLFFQRTRSLSGYVFSGTAGTLPGFIIGNLLFWVLFIGVLRLLKGPIDRLPDTDFVRSLGGRILILMMIGGLALANILGCGIGFFSGCWIYRKIKKRKASTSIR